MNVTLQTPRLIMRPPQPGDWMAFHDFMMSDRATAFNSHGDLAKVWRAFAAELGHWEIFGYGTAVSYISHTNARSIRLAEKLGAKLDVAAIGPTADTLVYRHPIPKGVIL